MTTHELARQLLAGPDQPVQLLTETFNNAIYGDIGDVKITAGHSGNDNVTMLSAYDDDEDEE